MIRAEPNRNPARQAVNPPNSWARRYKAGDFRIQIVQRIQSPLDLDRIALTVQLDQFPGHAVRTLMQRYDIPSRRVLRGPDAFVATHPLAEPAGKNVQTRCIPALPRRKRCKACTQLRCSTIADINETVPAPITDCSTASTPGPDAELVTHPGSSSAGIGRAIRSPAHARTRRE